MDVYESTPVTRIEPARTPGGDAAAVTAHGTVRATYVLRATEGFTSGLPGLHRTWLPMNSSLVVTEPLPASTWQQIGWAGRETLGDLAHAYMYAQRTADDRIAIGGRGVPYRYGSRTDHDGKTQGSTIAALQQILHRLLPATRDAAVDHAWSGVLGVPRDWCSTAGSTAAPASAGPAATSATASRRPTWPAGRCATWCSAGPPTSPPCPGWAARCASWEPEPLRWLGVQTLYAAYRAADRQERRGGGTALVAKVADRISART